MSRAEEQALKAYPNIKIGEQHIDQSPAREVYVQGYEQAMAEIEEKIAQVKKNGTWDGVDVDEFMREVRGE